MVTTPYPIEKMTQRLKVRGLAASMMSDAAKKESASGNTVYRIS